ncbi:MAG: hypothetical protein J3R72DRAFT_441263 [Linnemannia gamsii]|nr:MAG: hypothetical protein J3R72DRAFT_441263 [Linnemannia gamsii]
MLLLLSQHKTTIYGTSDTNIVIGQGRVGATIFSHGGRTHSLFVFVVPPLCFALILAVIVYYFFFVCSSFIVLLFVAVFSWIGLTFAHYSLPTLDDVKLGFFEEVIYVYWSVDIAMTHACIAVLQATSKATTTSLECT